MNDKVIIAIPAEASNEQGEININFRVSKGTKGHFEIWCVVHRLQIQSVKIIYNLTPWPLDIS